MKKIFITALIACLTSYINAQSNYLSGYIITNESDTVRGLIDYRGGERNQKQCQFKESELAEVKTYLPGDIYGYRLGDGGKYYITKDITIDGNTHTAFIELLVQGIMDLYYYRHNSLTYFGFEKFGSPMDVVTKMPDRIEESKWVPDNRYIGILTYMFRDYPPIKEKIEKLPFDKKAFIDIVKEYHDKVCVDDQQCIVFENKNPNASGLIFKFSVYAGLVENTYSFNGGTSGYLESKTTNPMIGGQVNLINPRWTKDVSLQFDFSIANMKSDDDATGKNSPLSGQFYKQEHSYDYNAINLSFRLGIKYTYSKFKIRPTVEAGVLRTNLLNRSYTEHVKSYRESHTNEIIIIDTDREGEMLGSMFGYYVALGIDYGIGKSQAVFIRAVYEDYPKDAIESLEKIKTPHIKLGFTF